MAERRGRTPEPGSHSFRLTDTCTGPKGKGKRGRKGSGAVNEEEAPAAKEVEPFIIFQGLFFLVAVFVFGRRQFLSPPAPAIQGLIALCLEPGMVP